MQDPKVWNKVSKHLAEKESSAETDDFIAWLEENEENKQLFHALQNVWNGSTTGYPPKMNFKERFTWPKIKTFLWKKALGNLVAFVIGFGVTTLFSHHMLERKSLRNLYGIAGRKTVVVNDIPEWCQSALAILMGYITLELIQHIFETKMHIKWWKRLTAAKI